MMQPLLHLFASRPQLLADHAEAYAELAGAELGELGADWKRRALLNAAALCGLGVAAVLAGVALMLWAVIPVAQMPMPWALWVTPLPPLALALCCLAATRATGQGRAFDQLRRQLQADLLMLRGAADGPPR